jgi:hypothetical protein
MRRLTVVEPSDFGFSNGRRGAPRDAEAGEVLVGKFKDHVP